MHLHSTLLSNSPDAQSSTLPSDSSEAKWLRNNTAFFCVVDEGELYST